MKNPWRSSRGSITLVALLLATAIGISLASYLALCRQSLFLSSRNQQITQARQLAEGGLEAALYQLNQGSSPTTWTSTTSMGNGVTGTVTTTVLYSAPATPNTPRITAIATVTAPGYPSFTRTLTATTKPAALFANALGIINPTAAVPYGNTYAVIFNSGGGALVDSWDSDYLGYAPLGPTALSSNTRDYNSTTTYPGSTPATLFTSAPIPYGSAIATPSTYPDLSFNYAAVVAAPNVRLNSAEIRGYAMTFGNAINYTTGAGGSIVAAPPAAPGTPPTPPPNIDTARVSKSAFVPSFAVSVPTGAPYGTLDGSTSITIDNSGGSTPQKWEASPTDLTLNGTTVTIKGHVIVTVAGNLNLVSGGKFIVYQPVTPGPDTGRLEIFVGGNINIGDTIAPASGFENSTYEPKRLALYSTSTSPSRIFQYSTTLPFCGVMYSAAPTSAKIDFQASSPEIFGAILANSNIEFNGTGTAYVHYDTALQYLPRGWFKGVTTPFIIVQLTES